MASFSKDLFNIILENLKDAADHVYTDENNKTIFGFSEENLEAFISDITDIVRDDIIPREP